jgi:phenylacetate-CoA ligase
MKKVLILLSLCLSAMVPGLSAPPLKILHIGNSYTVDAAAMLPRIVSASGSTGTPFEVPQDTLCRKRRIAAINLGNELIGFRFLQEPMVHLRSLKQYYSGDPSVINKGLNITYADNANLNDKKIKDIIDVINGTKAKVVRSYTTPVDIICNYAITHKLSFESHPTFILGGEGLLESLRISAVFT